MIGVCFWLDFTKEQFANSLLFVHYSIFIILTTAIYTITKYLDNNRLYDFLDTPKKEVEFSVVSKINSVFEYFLTVLQCYT